MSESGADAGVHSEGWLRRSGYFREVVGYEEAVDLLSDPRMLARFVEIFEGIGITSGPLWEAAASSLLSLNGEEHRRLRSIVAERFTPRAVERIRPLARETADRLVASFESAGRCELISEFAEPYVTTGTCRFVGFAEDDVASLWHAVQTIGLAMKDMSKRIADLDQGLELLAFARREIAARRERSNDDVITVIADAVERGELPEPVALVIVTTLLSAGLEPTVNQVGITVAVLADHPDVWDAVARGEVAATNAVESVLRLRSTNQGAARRVGETFEYGGVCFNEGETVLVSLAAANHDPRRFAEPDRLTLDTDRNSHLAFGFGPHFCLGAALARVQLQEAVATLTRRLTCPTVVAIEQHDAGGLIGPFRLEIRFSARPSRSS